MPKLLGRTAGPVGVDDGVDRRIYDPVMKRRAASSVADEVPKRGELAKVVPPRRVYSGGIQLERLPGVEGAIVPAEGLASFQAQLSCPLQEGTQLFELDGYLTLTLRRGPVSPGFVPATLSRSADGARPTTTIRGGGGPGVVTGVSGISVPDWALMTGSCR